MTSELTTSSVELTSTTETAPATTTITDVQITYSCPGGFPAESSCDVKLNPNMQSGARYIKSFDAEDVPSLDDCVRACVANKNCDFFAFWPNMFCELWEGNYERSDVVVSWSWFELSCFCVPGREAITTEATTTVAMTSEATTTTEAATTTTAALGESCVNNERSPVPSDKVCNKHGYYDGTTMTELGSPSGANTKESCRDACHDTNGCAYFAFSPNSFCSLYGGTIEAVTDQETTYIWYDMDCFCDLDS
ncbi:hypothetical protein FNYG_07228 [Fusarium nygamai]|uniref:Apple domain-containing protein n=1 Tax=Gibberella nygamai TaxID=42673 RepID=A0A2K0WAU9_GIBNY|nr:hypothetical protein FNYG_07228 [Fusarium nygamai]